MSDLKAKCPACGDVWLVAKLPMPLMEAAALMTAARCPAGCDAPPKLASGDLDG